MKKTIHHIAGLAIGMMLFSACKNELDLKPYDGLTTEETTSTFEGLKAATIGNYNYIKDPYYTRYLHFFTEYPSDNVSLSGTTTDPLFYSYNYQHQRNQGDVAGFWRKAYQAIYGTNVIIEKLPQSENVEENQLLGENYFLRAMIHFDLVKVFGRPYTENNGSSPGVMIRTNTDVNDLPPRSTVKDVYDQVVSDLKKGAALMQSVANQSDSRRHVFASHEVAQALLSRVYLYMGDYPNAHLYADSVIKSDLYSLVSTAALPAYFRGKPEDNPETIFAVKHELKDDQLDAAIGSMYFSAGIGYGEMYASQSYRTLIGKFPQDVRNRFIEIPYLRTSDGQRDSLDARGNRIPQKRNGYTKYFITKYSYQEGYETLSSPVVLRLAEMYLTRAEAADHLGKTTEAMTDLNTIRQRAGLSGNALFTPQNMMGYATLLDAILDERRLELAWECQRKFDVFRNKRDLNRSYPGTHLPSGTTTQIIKYTDPRVVFYIPEAEITLNPKLTQNP
ncbi:MAG: RagB/SusD family nutrient uptake outer membrane protein [Mucilaginibacter polytrichastri]|nr:RagB/SusD family nutrient uptake outer membrane protein [Mucilaginibacter polytrichastri]